VQYHSAVVLLERGACECSVSITVSVQVLQWAECGSVSAASVSAVVVQVF
jgi:hypothetical protein